jgi:Ca-activated chloride channel homolog
VSRGASVAVVATMLIVGGRAFAQTPVEGGGDFAQAPVLGPGTYVDSIRLRETLFYAVELAAGQDLRATASVRNVPDNPAPAIVALDLTIFDPLREEAGRDSTVMAGPARRARLGVTGRTVAGADPTSAQAGTYVVAVSMTPFRGEFRDVEYPVQLGIEVTGEAVPVPGPTSTSSPSAPAPSPEPPTVAEQAPTRQAGWSLSELALFGAIGLLAGGVLGAFGARKLRR